MKILRLKTELEKSFIKKGEWIYCTYTVVMMDLSKLKYEIRKMIWMYVFHQLKMTTIFKGQHVHSLYTIWCLIIGCYLWNKTTSGPWSSMTRTWDPCSGRPSPTSTSWNKSITWLKLRYVLHHIINMCTVFIDEANGLVVFLEKIAIFRCLNGEIVFRCLQD
jgi:hypothetical protein